ncbi:MAG TPA: hypothetical protein VFS39_13435 [Nitrospira sp.]|nr:hypothetical protein [Nitrospira sp.]
MKDESATLPWGAPSSTFALQSAGIPALHVLLLIFIFNFTLQPLTEPDFGWHLRAGLDMLDHGGRVPPTDPYSHTMPDWHWVEHAWLTDIIVAILYRSFGGMSVILLFGVLSAAAWLIAGATASASTTARLVASVFSLWVALPYLGARTQLVSLLGLALMLLVAIHARDKWTWSIPALFVFWANLHGGFTAGLFYLGLIAVGGWLITTMSVRWPAWFANPDESVLSREDLIRIAGVIAASLAVTFVNPYGWRLHVEILDSLSNDFMLATLREWQPLSLDSAAGRRYALYLMVLSVAMALWYRRFQPRRWIVLSVFLLLSFRHMRNIPIFLIMSLPLSAELVQAAYDSLSSRLRFLTRKEWTVTAVAGTALLLAWLGPDHLQHVLRSGIEPAKYFRDTSYPIEGIEWIKRHREVIGTKMYNDYRDGGFLLWWLPEQKIFIDGRMPAWEIGERKIFRDYVAVAESDAPALTVLEKYGVDWALVRYDSALDRGLDGQPKWTRAYRDGKVSLYVRK